MDYVEWYELVLQTMGNAADESAQIRNGGIDYDTLANRVWGQNYSQVVEHLNLQERDDVLFDVIFDLSRNRLVEDHNVPFIKLTRAGRTAARNLFLLWEKACGISVDSLMKNALRIINRHSNQPHEYFGRASSVSMNTVHCELDDENLTEEDVYEVLRELKAVDLAYWDGGDCPDDITSTYQGFVWEVRRDQVIGARFIDRLVAEWETTSVEFKRELHLDTADQKAEFIKDLIGLANTQASGQRWLIIGFDDKARAYYSHPDASVTQNRIEHILADYIEPNLDVRYEVMSYKSGKVGVFEVLRDPKKLPYKVAKSLGDKSLGAKCRIAENQIFVRHGSQTESPSDLELDALYREAERAHDIAN